MPAYGKPLAGVCVATALFACGAGGFPVAPADVPASSGTLALTANNTHTTHLQPGANVTIAGGGFAGHANVTIAVYSTPTTIEHVTASATGQIAATFAMPTNLTGTHTITAIGVGPGRTPRALEARVDIAPAAWTLPRTGIDLGLWLLSGVALMLAGFVLIRTAVFRRRLLPGK